MAEMNGGNRGGDPFTSQLRSFDERIANFRNLYVEYSVDEKSRFRAWIERAATLSAEGDEWCAMLRVRTEYDVCDESGNTILGCDAEFPPSTVLGAIRAWEAGQEYAPSSTQP